MRVSQCAFALHQLENLTVNNDHCLTPDQLDDKYNPDGDGEHPTHTRFDWRQALAEQSTISGYWVWVHHVLNNQP
jgi:hypothetical protein